MPAFRDSFFLAECLIRPQSPRQPKRAFLGALALRQRQRKSREHL